MSKDIKSISLTEWQTLSPTTCNELKGLFLENSSSSQQLVDLLNKSRLLKVAEMKNGLEVSSFSHVGRIRIGGLDITIFPKLKAASLLRLLRYAYGFRRLKLVSNSTHLVDQCGLEDLLVSQLNAEALELVSRGVHRAYVRQDERLASPRGRIYIQRLAFDGGLATAKLPCQHFSKLEDTILNRVLLSGLKLAGSVASLLDLRRESIRLASFMAERVSRISLEASVLDKADKALTRLSAPYAPVLSIIRLLVESQGVVLEGKSLPATLPGFLFDMNSFFQSLLFRFLNENLVEFTVRDEHGLKGMMRYNPSHNPQGKRAPTPRPDYAIFRRGQLVSLLDAKYRDLWEKSLPREMLYQLVVYAISHRQELQSTILYPTANSLAKEARINVTDPIYGKHLGQVCLRPVNLIEIEHLVSSSMADARRKRESLAKRLALGTEN